MRVGSLAGGQPEMDTLPAMAKTILELAGATRLARAIACDLSLYNNDAIEHSLREGRPFAGLGDELLEARHLFLQRVAARLEPVPLLVRTVQEFFASQAAQQGLPVAGLAEALAAGLESGADRLALLVVGGQPDLGRIIPLGDGVQDIGRIPPADIVFDVDSVARRHARLVVDGAHVVVEDVESTGGTFVNDEKVRSAPLAVGARLQLGGVNLTLIRVAMVEAAPGDPQTAHHELTRTLQRRALLDALAQALNRRGPLTLVLYIHEPYGQALGDEVREAVATRLTEAARAHQGFAIGRDGVAFLVVLPGPDAAAREHAEEVRVAVTREPVATREGPIQASLSIGVALRPDGSALAPEALLERAWAACAVARPAGRDGVA